MFGRRSVCESVCLIVLGILFIHHNYANARVRFTNCKCESLNTTYATFPYCFLKSLNRSYQYFSMKAAIYQLPIAKASFRWTVLKKANGYRPFLYNITMDGCKYLRNPKVNSVASFLYDLFKEYTNINHSCPFDHDILVDKLPNTHINHQLTKVLPFPRGEYQLDTTWLTYGVERARVKVYIELS